MMTAYIALYCVAQ